MRDKPDSKSEASGFIYMFGGFALYTSVMVYLMIQKGKGTPFIDNLLSFNSFFLYASFLIAFLLNKLKKKPAFDIRGVNRKYLIAIWSFLGGIMISIMFFILIL